MGPVSQLVHLEMNTFRELIFKHRGKKICVMGGSPHLAEDIEDVRADVWIAANDHGARLRPVDYIVAMDNIHCVLHKPMLPFLREVSDAPIIGPWPDYDYYLTHWPGSPRKTFSGLVAAWIAWAMGAHPVILAGFDSYAGKMDNGRAKRKAKMFADYIQGDVRACRGSFGDLWPMYSPTERYGRYKPHSAINGLLGVDEMIRIRCRKPANVYGTEWPPGTELEVGRHEVKALLKHRMVVEV